MPPPPPPPPPPPIPPAGAGDTLGAVAEFGADDDVDVAAAEALGTAVAAVSAALPPGGRGLSMAVEGRRRHGAELNDYTALVHRQEGAPGRSVNLGRASSSRGSLVGR